MYSEKDFKELFNLNPDNFPSIEEKMNYIAKLVDASNDLSSKEGLLKAEEYIDIISNYSLSQLQRAELFYFKGNVYHGLDIIYLNTNEENFWVDRKYTELELLLNRKSIQLLLAIENKNDIVLHRLAQSYTNLGNKMFRIGRNIEGIKYCESALEYVPNFPMAVGSVAKGLHDYAFHLPRNEAYLYRYKAYQHYQSALSNPKYLEGNAYYIFKSEYTRLFEFYGEQLHQEIDFNAEPLGDDTEEIEYREWVLENRLFLNELNELGTYSIASEDTILIDGIVYPFDEKHPLFETYFNNLKQEFVSARWLAYESIKANDTFSNEPHLSDKRVLLVNTLDYPMYGLNTQKLLLAFRMIYSILDKISYFINDYFHLNQNKRRVSFRNVWYKNMKQKDGLKGEITSNQNQFLKALFWLSKDIYINDSDFREAMEPEAQKIDEIRNHLEHKYLRVIDMMIEDRLIKNAFHIEYKEMQKVTINLFQLVRAALIYLTKAIKVEEQRKANEKSGYTVSLPLAFYDDEWKK